MFSVSDFIYLFIYNRASITIYDVTSQLDNKAQTNEC